MIEPKIEELESRIAPSVPTGPGVDGGYLNGLDGVVNNPAIPVPGIVNNYPYDNFHTSGGHMASLLD